MTPRWLGLAVVGAASCAPTNSDLPAARGPTTDAAQDAGVDSDAAPEPSPVLPRNLIVIMGDGMGPQQLGTARFAKPEGLRLDAMSGPAFANTDSLTTRQAADPDANPTDSAAAATAIASGAWVFNGSLSQSPEGAPLKTVLELCKSAGKATGLVTTSFFYDASPAAFAVHQHSRDDSVAIVRQMLNEASPDVILGASTALFDNPASGLQADAEAAGYLVLRGVAALANWDPTNDKKLLGLFVTDFVPVAPASEPFSMTPALERRPDSPDPTLATMMARALDRLGNDPDGFFLFAEDEILDEMGHRGPAEPEWANRAYPQQAAALDDAVGVALDWVEAHSSFEETLIVLLADHETGGYHFDHVTGPASGRFEAFTQGDAFPTGNHTRAAVAVYAVGPGSSAIEQVHDHVDTHRLLIGTLANQGSGR